MRNAIICMLLVITGVMASEPADEYSKLDITMLNQDPDPAKQGDYVELRWKVVKEGNEKIDDLRFHLEAEYPFFFDRTDSPDKRVGAWQGWSEEEEYYILYYKLRVDEEALENSYKVKLQSTRDDSGLTQEYEYEIRVGDDLRPQFAIGNIVSSPLKLLADTDENQLQLTVENIGDENAEVVITELLLPEAFSPTYSYATRANLGTVNAGGSKTATFYVDIDKDAKAGEHEALLLIRYKEALDDDDEYRSVSLPARIHLNGKPMFNITGILPDDLRPGSTVNLHVQVHNVGAKEAQSVSIRAFKESSQPFEFDEKTDFIGKLNPGETGEGVLTFTISDEALAKKYLLDLEVRSIYNEEVFTDSEVIPISVQQKEKRTLSNGMIIASGAAILAIGGLLAYRFRKD